MGDGNLLAYLIGAPLWLVAIIFAIRSFKDWPGIMGRWNERQRDRASIESEQYRRLADWCTRLQNGEERCQEELGRAIMRIAELEGYNMGRGAARQEAAEIVATERLEDRAERRRAKPSEE